MDSLRLVHLIHTPRHSGAEMLVYELCRLHRAWGHDCAVASFAPPQPEFLKEAAELERLGVDLFFPGHARVKFGRTIHYRNAIRSFRPDAVFGHSVLPSLYGRFATGLGKNRIPYATVMHSATNYAAPVFMLAERLMRFRVDHVVSVSGEAAGNYIRQFGNRIPVSVIPNGIDIKRFAQIDRECAREKLGLAGGVRLALQVGRICDVKQQQLSLAALRPLLAAGAVQLWFAGLTEDSAFEGRLRRMISQLQLDHTVRFLGSRGDVPDLLAAADLYLMPSRQEAQGIALLEALASGVPVVASDIPPFAFARHLPEVRICGVADEPAWTKAARDMLGSPRATRDIEAFSIERTAQAYLDLVSKSKL